MDEDVSGGAEVGGDAEDGGDEDVDTLNVDKYDDGDGANYEVGMDSMEVDDDAFVLNPRDIVLIEGMRKTSFIKRTVLSRSQLAGSSMCSSFVPLINQKGVPNYPGRKEVRDDERELLDNFWKDKNMTTSKVLY